MTMDPKVPRTLCALRSFVIILGLVMLIVWIISGWYWIYYAGSAHLLSVSRGCLFVEPKDPECILPGFFWLPKPTDPELHLAKIDLVWRPKVEFVPNAGFALTFPLWIPPFVCTIFVVLATLRIRKEMGGHCRRCRYCLTGNVSGRCPECGSLIRP